jgi:two-component system phosphate regulon sensor histidine kinase PhoR
MAISVQPASGNTYEQAFARAPIGMALVGLNNRWLEVNDALCAICGRTRDDLIGNPFESTTHPDDVDDDAALAAQVVRGERELFMREKRYLRPDGSVRWVDVTGTLVRDDAGNPLHFVFHIQDITERRGAVLELSRSEERFRTAFDDALTGLVLIGPDGRLRRMNAVACKMLGCDADRIVGVPAAEFTHPDDAEADAERMRSLLAGAVDGTSWEKRYVHSSGRTVWAEASTVLVRKPDGSPSHFVTQIADISDRKQAERVKDEFLATISHELRTPLTSIEGYTDLLSEDAELSPGVRRNAVAVIQRNAERLRRLVDDVQFIAQARADTLEMHREEVELDGLIAECAEWAGPRATEVEIELSLQTEPIHMRDADPSRLVQAVDHLIANALIYTNDGGRVEVRLTRQGGDAVLEVADSGIGISEDDQPHLFDRFFRSSGVVDAAAPGVGLGLSIVKTIAEMHGGQVGVESALGEGSTFTVRLPIGS